MTTEKMSEVEKKEVTVPPFVQICTAVAEAFGKGDDFASADVLYGLDALGRVWRFELADPDNAGSRDGWELMTNDSFRLGTPPAQPKRTR